MLVCSVVLFCFSCCGRERRLILLTESWGSTLQSWLLPGCLPPWVHIAAACWPAWQLQLTQSLPASLPSLCLTPDLTLSNLWPFSFCLFKESQKSCDHSHCLWLIIQLLLYQGTHYNSWKKIQNKDLCLFLKIVKHYNFSRGHRGGAVFDTHTGVSWIYTF